MIIIIELVSKCCIDDLTIHNVLLLNTNDAASNVVEWSRTWPNLISHCSMTATAAVRYPVTSLRNISRVTHSHCLWSTVVTSRDVYRLIACQHYIVTRPAVSCRQEVVNLLLTGSASSHVFNDTLEQPSESGDIVIRKGISQRADIGLLSLKEYYKKLQVTTSVQSYNVGRYPAMITRADWY